MPRIFVSRTIPDPGLNLLRSVFGDGVDVFPEDRLITREELLHGVAGADAILPILTETVDATVMDAAGPQLKIIANYAVGYNNIDVAAATERGIPVTNTPGVLTETTADLTWALILGTARRIGEGERYLRGNRWKSWGPKLLMGVDVYGKTLGVLGMGRIGQAVARRAKGFGMRIIYTKASALDPTIKAELDAEEVDMPTILAESDILSLHCPLNDQTRHLIGAAEFGAMKESCIFINTTRGPVVNEDELVVALKRGIIRAAGLDVFEEEPQVHPGLLECENALLMPHLGSATEETRGKMAEIAATNIIARLRGELPPNCVNPEVL